MLISTAAGAVGSVAVRLGKVRGARVIALTGRDQKVAYLTDELGADVALNYNAPSDLAAALRQAAPDGIDAFFDMVGGEQLRAGFDTMATQGRIAICGTISQANSDVKPAGVMHERDILVRRLCIRGFLLSDFAPLFEAGRRELAHWLKRGEISARIDLLEGLHQAPHGLARVLRGENLGQQLVKVADPV